MYNPLPGGRYKAHTKSCTSYGLVPGSTCRWKISSLPGCKCYYSSNCLKSLSVLVRKRCTYSFLLGVLSMGRTGLSLCFPCAFMLTCTSCRCHQPWSCLRGSGSVTQAIFHPKGIYQYTDSFSKCYTVTDNVCGLLQAEFLIAVSRQRAIYPNHMGV